MFKDKKNYVYQGMTPERTEEIRRLTTDSHVWNHCLGRAFNENRMASLSERIELAFTYYTEAKQAEYKAKEDDKLVCTWLGEQLALDVSENRRKAAMLILEARFPKIIDYNGWDVMFILAGTMAEAQAEETRLQQEVEEGQ